MTTLILINEWCEARREPMARLYWGVAWVSCLLTIRWGWFAVSAFGFSLSAYLLSVRPLTET